MYDQAGESYHVSVSNVKCVYDARLLGKSYDKVWISGQHIMNIPELEVRPCVKRDGKTEYTFGEYIPGGSTKTSSVSSEHTGSNVRYGVRFKISNVY